MDINNFLYRPCFIDLGLWLSRTLPQGVGYRLADFVAGRIAAQRNSPTTRAIRANQWVVNGENMSATELDQVVLDTLRHTARCTFDLFRYANDQAAMNDQIVYGARIEKLLQMNIEGKLNAVGLGVHISNFDMVAQAAYMRGLRALVISLPDTNGALNRQHAMREKAGFEILPASKAALREAIKRLQGGECILSAIDRPIQETKYFPRFFGRPAPLPILSIYLALKAKVPIVVLANIKRPDGKYHLLASDFIEMQPHPDRNTEIIQNAEYILEIAADFIRQSPYQWGMPIPVWPAVYDEVPWG
jgi:KDO2-lipid IV(A) lauroyltransferase